MVRIHRSSSERTNLLIRSFFFTMSWIRTGAPAQAGVAQVAKDGNLGAKAACNEQTGSLRMKGESIVAQVKRN